MPLVPNSLMYDVKRAPEVGVVVSSVVSRGSSCPDSAPVGRNAWI